VIAFKGQLERRAGRQAASHMEAAAELGLSAAPSERITMQDLLHQGDRLVLIGAPGCGKTTVLQHIAWTLAEALRTHQLELATARLGLSGALPLPIYVPLSLYADHRRRFATDPDPHRRQLATFINHYLVERQAGLHLPEDFFATLLDQGQHVLLLLDGLDEVPSEDERALVKPPGGRRIRDRNSAMPGGIRGMQPGQMWLTRLGFRAP
jgi:predicted NACHT family NTPase